ncbi:MAG: Gfo/Idh/MocA family oxidoreductase [Chloroflexi bacterium]|nr:Gfo/Idh/MocA family oxidoreductase [Chloroflexota bacterium]
MGSSPLHCLKIGIAGAGGRGGAFRDACQSLGVHIHAVCDTNPQRLDAAAAQFGADQKYTDFGEMLAESNLDAVIIGTPMYLHAEQSIQALERGVHVMSEVTAAVSLQECRRLVQACKQSGAAYMLAENCNYMKPNVIVKEMVTAGLFGQTYYAEGEYLHELKELNELTPWRRRWQTGVNGVTYGTHNLGPILQWMPGDRIIAVCCAGSGHHYRDPRGALYENEDTCVMLCKLASGGLAQVRVDMLSNRPYGLTFKLQGTTGAYESAREHGQPDRVWLQARTRERERWIALDDFEDEFLPPWWKQHAPAALRSGHDGSDYYILLAFLETIAGRRPCPIGIHEAMDMTLPGLISQQSILQNGVWLEVPDTRIW